MPGKPIVVGGVELPAQLLEAGLIDEFHIVVFLVIAGEGRRLFDGANLQENTQLRLVKLEVLPAGCVALHYEKAI